MRNDVISASQTTAAKNKAMNVYAQFTGLFNCFIYYCVRPNIMMSCHIISFIGSVSAVSITEQLCSNSGFFKQVFNVSLMVCMHADCLYFNVYVQVFSFQAATASHEMTHTVV